MEEANEFDYADYMTLKLRMSAPRPKVFSQQKLDRISIVNPFLRNQIFLSFNPMDEYHWLKEKLIDQAVHPITKENIMPSEVNEIHSTYIDNPFLSLDYIKMLEDLIDQDPNYYRIYVEGEWGRLEHLIYSNWQECDSFPNGLEEIYGLDFGFNNPTALLRIGYDGKELWEEQLIYNTKLTNQDLIKLMNDIGVSKKRWIYADSAEPDRITEIRRAGYLIKPGDKKVNPGIDFVKRMRVNVVRTSSDLLKEKKSYSYRVDKNGNATDEPIACLNHFMDGERYAVYTHWGKGRRRGVRFV
jgi:phage terminase large subunit